MENTLYYYYDESSISGLEYNGTKYTYVKNLQGDVIGIINDSGVTVVEYTYDAWGNILSITGSMASTLGAANPFRYRGYYYDTESGWYYLQSRYYDPQVGRFLNADSYVSTEQGLSGYIKLPIGGEAFSFGIMFIGSDVKDEKIIKHEYGHAVHYEKLGPVVYTVLCGIPTLWDYKAKTKPYYAEPQEHAADYYGKVDRADADGNPYPYNRSFLTTCLIIYSEFYDCFSVP